MRATYRTAVTRGASRCSLALVAVCLLAASWTQAQEVESVRRLAVCATTPDLAALARHVGGEDVEVTVFTKGPQDPHSVEARPSFVRALHDADVLLVVGLGLEEAWVPTLVRTARNPSVQAGGAGYIDVSTAIRVLGRVNVPSDRSAGDVHAAGNPHFLLDPVNGIRVAALLANRFAKLRVERRAAFERRYGVFRGDILERLLGETLAKRYGGEQAEKIVELLDRGGTPRFLEFLDSTGEREELGGWLAALAPHAGARVLGDHDAWPYLVARFQLKTAGFLEPLPGLAPTSRHLARLVLDARQEPVRSILLCPYTDRRSAEFIVERLSIPIAELAHQCGARAETDAYAELVDQNVRALVRVFSGARLR